MEIIFPGGKKVDAELRGFTIRTDQPEVAGGANTAPSPFDLFLASLGTCAGFYVLSFCQKRSIPADEISLTLATRRDEASRLIDRVEIVVHLPSDFPEKYVDACLKAAEQCSVKKHLLQPPHVALTAARA